MESAKIEKVDQLTRIADLYFNLNSFATKMQMKISYNQFAEMRAVFPKFRYCMIELYYLVRFSDTIKNDLQFYNAMNTWISDDLRKGVDQKYCKYSLKLFSIFIGKLVHMGVIEGC